MSQDGDDRVELQPWTTSVEAPEEPALAKRLGFEDGARTVIHAFSWLLSTPRVWGYALVPVLVLVLLSGAAGYLAIAWVMPWMAALFGSPATSLELFFAVSASWMAAAVAGIVGLMLAWLLTPPLSAPALEMIVRARERALGAPPRSGQGFFRELICGIRAQAAIVLVIVPLLGILWLCDWLFPPGVIVTIPLKLGLTAIGLAWGLLDYPLTLRGISLRNRWRLLRDNPLPVLGFGFAFLLLFWIPCSSVLLLPVGVAAASELCFALLQKARQS